MTWRYQLRVPGGLAIDAAREAVRSEVTGARLVRPTEEDDDFRVESPSGRVLGRGRSPAAAWIAAERNSKGGAG